ncbi:MAG: ATP-binding protein [Planctomycetota bacterium]
MTVEPLVVGVALGVVLALPAAWWWSRRTERRVLELERRARAAERLAELGTMTGGLAHEIKNPLSTVGLNVQLIEEDLVALTQDLGEAHELAHHREQLARTRRRVQGLSRETARLRDILEDFLRFAGRVELDRRPTDLNALCEELIDFFQPQADESRVNLRADLTAAPAVASVDASLLKQALLNLMINACQAMTESRDRDTPAGGNNELILRTANVPDRTRDAEPRVAVHVTDTGPGIDAESVAKIFQPYFSTKRGGTGLGLPTSRRLIEEHGGELTVHAARGRGSDFVITLPVAMTPEPHA